MTSSISATILLGGVAKTSRTSSGAKEESRKTLTGFSKAKGNKTMSLVSCSQELVRIATIKLSLASLSKSLTVKLLRSKSVRLSSSHTTRLAEAP